MILDILYITPTEALALAIRRAYPPIHDAPLVSARPVFSFGGTRAMKVVVMPFPAEWSPAQIEQAEEAIRSDAQCRLVPGGELVRL